MPKLTITKVLDHTKRVSEGLKAAASYRTMAGVPREKGIRKPEEGESQTINNAALMYIHEFGAPEANIPPRPVIHPAIKEIRKEVVLELASMAKAAMDGKPSVVMQTFNRIGILAQNAMRKRITDGPFIPLKPSTIAARKAQGYKGEKPLIRTGQLRRALTYVVRKLGFFGN